MDVGNGISVVLESSLISGSTVEGIGLSNGGSVQISDSTLTDNREGIWGDGNIVVKLYGGANISANRGRGISLSAGSSIITRGTNVINNNQSCGISIDTSFFKLGSGEIDISGGCGISCDAAIGICNPGDISGSINGCGSQCARP
jgi:hypothetical protein